MKRHPCDQISVASRTKTSPKFSPRNIPTNRFAGERVQQRQHSLPHGAADIFEIDNDPVRAGALQLFGAIDER
jgi:hypothetical protein